MEPAQYIFAHLGTSNRRILAYHSVFIHQRLPLRLLTKTLVTVPPRTPSSRRIWGYVWSGHRTRPSAHLDLHPMQLRCGSLCSQLPRYAILGKTWEILCWDRCQRRAVVLCDFGYFLHCDIQHLRSDSDEVHQRFGKINRRRDPYSDRMGNRHNNHSNRGQKQTKLPMVARKSRSHPGITFGLLNPGNWQPYLQQSNKAPLPLKQIK